MLTNDGTRLRVFENFRVDYTLPKHVPTSRDALMMATGNRKAPRQMRQRDFDEMSDSMDEPRFSVAATGTALITVAGDLIDTARNGHKKPWYKRWWAAFWHAFTRTDDPVEEVPTLLTTFEFFAALKNSVEELEAIAGIAQEYEKAIQKAGCIGQKALVEKLAKGAEVARAEAQLLAIGEATYLTEDTVVEFVKKSEKGVRLDWLPNFLRPVPDDLVVKKLRCDELMIFDAYAIMHYDPQGKSWAETEAEREERKRRQRDPILFGLIRGSRRLYYLGDWEDDTCDLTLNELARVMGGDVTKELI